MSNQNEKKLLMNKLVYLGPSLLDIIKIAMHEYWYDSVKLKHKDKDRLCYMDTDTFTACIKTGFFFFKIGIHSMQG